MLLKNYFCLFKNTFFIAEQTKGTVVNRTMPSLHRGPLKITHTCPFKYKSFALELNLYLVNIFFLKICLMFKSERSSSLTIEQVSAGCRYSGWFTRCRRNTRGRAFISFSVRFPTRILLLQRGCKKLSRYKSLLPSENLAKNVKGLFRNTQ